MTLKKPTLNYIRNMVHQSEGTSKIDKDFIAEIIKSRHRRYPDGIVRGIRRRRQQFNVVTDTNEQKVKRCKSAQTNKT